MAMCWCCGEEFPDERKVLGYSLCLVCGVEPAKAESKQKSSMVQIPYSKGAYQYIHNPMELCFTNPKRTT
jgi:hypothetical protein